MVSMLWGGYWATSCRFFLVVMWWVLGSRHCRFSAFCLGDGVRGVGDISWGDIRWFSLLLPWGGGVVVVCRFGLGGHVVSKLWCGYWAKSCRFFLISRGVI